MNPQKARIKINDSIVADSKICHGRPTFKGTRIMVWQVLELLAAGESIEAIIEDFPSLTPRHIRAALGYAACISEGSYCIAFPRRSRDQVRMIARSPDRLS